MDRLIISERQVGDVNVLDLDGNVSIGENSTALRTAIHRLLGDNRKKILLNLAKVRKVDSSGLGEIVSGFTAVEREGGSLKILNLTHNLLDLISITKLLTVFDTFENEEDALRSFPFETVQSGVGDR